MPYPPLWGTMFHDMLFFVALQYPAVANKDKQQALKLLLANFFYLLPCPGCSLHAQAYWTRFEGRVDFSSQTSVFQFLVDMHNDINRRLNKRSNWTVKEAHEAFYRRHFTNLAKVHRSDQVRVEDHQRIAELEKRLALSGPQPLLGEERAQEVKPQAPVRSAPVLQSEDNSFPLLEVSIVFFVGLLVGCLLLLAFRALLPPRNATAQHTSVPDHKYQPFQTED